MTWRATDDAEWDLEGLVTFGARKYGIAAALNYYDILIEAFERLAANPQVAPERWAKRQAVRLYPCRAHHVLYLIEDEDIVILRVLHHSANWIDHL